MVIDRYSPKLYQNLGIFLPLITVNCAILGASLFNGDSRVHVYPDDWVWIRCRRMGWLLAIMAMAGIRTRLNESRVPEGLRGPGITLIIAGNDGVGVYWFYRSIGVTN